MLKLFASLRGVSENHINYEVNKWLTLLGKFQFSFFNCMKLE